MLVLKKVLGERGVSQGKLARAADIAEAGLCRVMRGAEPCGADRGQRIADALGWEGDWRELFAEVGEGGEE